MAEFILNCIGEACPVPTMKSEKKLGEMSVGDILIVETDDSCVMINLPDFAIKQGHKVEVEEIGYGEWEVIIEKVK